jgi:hypothetical protein
MYDCSAPPGYADGKGSENPRASYVLGKRAPCLSADAEANTVEQCLTQPAISSSQGTRGVSRVRETETSSDNKKNIFRHKKALLLSYLVCMF